jgi:S1-C subfamily serine protease
MRAQLLHLSGPSRGRTITYEGPVVRVGSALDNQAVLPGHRVEPHHAQIEFVQDECLFHLKALDGQVFVNGNQVTEVILQNDDRIEFGAGGPMARFHVYVPIGAVCKPVRRMLDDAREVARVSGGAVATGTLTRDLLTQATTTLKVGVPAVIVVSAFLAGWLGGWIGSRPTEEDLARTADMVTQPELEELREQQARQQEALERMARVNRSVLRIQKEWSRGVCLLHGIFRVRMPDGSWFQRGPLPYEVEYTGSGFRVSAQGHIVTNRHVIAPWLEIPNLSSVLERGGVPEFVHLTATFPGKLPVDVPIDGIVRREDDIDVAVLRIDPERLEGVPVLPVRERPAEADDQSAIVVGYPTGLAALLARADSKIVDGLRQQSATFTDAIAALAAAGEVNPLITRGVVSEIRERQVVYDASTTHGGSGGPVFGADGEVIAVNYAVLPGFGGANFGVPIRYARELLP